MIRFLAVLALFAASAAAAPGLLGHELAIAIDPANASFESTDLIRAEGPIEIPIPPMEGVEVFLGEERIETLRVPEGPQTMRLTFRGTLRNAVQKSKGPTWVAGDSTPGTIGPDGSYLVRGFYLPSPEPLPFRVSIRVPLPHRAVSQGKRVEEREEEGMHVVTYDGGYPNDGVVVVTGPWSIEERSIDGVSCRAYLYEQDRAHAGILFSTLEQEIPRFQAIFGPVPDGRFDVVENFFATGYGFPQFTLLGDTVIRYVCAKSAAEGRKALPAGYLDHELVHCWLGNLVHVAYERGNWCEALTTYFANYGAAEREGKGAAHRAKVSRSFSLRVTPDRDYPLREFRDKRHDFENDIGYGKGSMVFHMLARAMGEEAFRAGVRAAVGKLGGTRAGWDEVLGAITGDRPEWREWLEPWLTRKGGPVLECGEVRFDGATVEGTIRQTQEGPPYPLAVPIRVTTAAGTEEFTVRSAARECAFRVRASADALRFEIDPEHELFRLVPRREVAPCLEAVLTHPLRAGRGDAETLRFFEVPPAEGAPPEEASLLSLGETDEAAFRAAGGSFGEGSFTWRGETYDRPGDAILFSWRRPGGAPATSFRGNGPEAYARLRYLGYYASDGFVVFRDGRPVARGDFEGDRLARAERNAAREGTAEPIVRDLLFLTDPRWKGRRAGSSEAYMLANELRGRLATLGCAVPPWPPVAVPELHLGPTRAITLLGAAGEPVRLEGAFFPFHKSASPAVATVFERIVVHPAEDAQKALVLLPEEATDEEARAYEAKGAAAVAVVASDPSMRARGREAAWPGAMPPAAGDDWKKRGGDAQAAAVAWLARSEGRPLALPYLYLPPDTAAALRDHAGKGVIEFEAARIGFTTSNLVGTIGPAGVPGILLSAHWDGVGTIDGTVAEGAADNAAGVAAVLFAAGELARDAKAGRLRRPVHVCLFGAEELGLWGSRQFAGHIRSGRAPFGPPLCAVNVDAIGNHAGGEVFLVGRTHAPRLLERFEAAFQGMTLGKEIDRFAFEEGSDHWPLHRAGIPAVTVFSCDYRSMNTLRDTLDRVEIAEVRRIAQAVYRMVRGLAEAESPELP